MTVLESTLYADRPRSVMTEVERIVNCGYTGRDEAAVEAHIEELAREGIASPEEFPTLYPKPAHLLSTADRMEVLGDRTSGEAEFVLFVTADGVYVGVGSDHTDRDLETDDVPLAKVVCPNAVGPDLWWLPDIEDHWDDLELRSWAVENGERVLYQETTLDAVLPPDELLALAESNVRAPLAGTALFSGSVATETDGLVCGERFEVELRDPVLDRRLACKYDIRVVGGLT